MSEPPSKSSEKTRKPTGSKPTDIWAFEITVPHLKAGPPSEAQPLTNPLSLSLAVDYVPTVEEGASSGIKIVPSYYLLHPEENEYDDMLHPVFTQLSTEAQGEGLSSDTFYYYTSNPTALHVLDTLISSGILRLHSEPAATTKVVQVLVPDKGIAKRCRWCEIWEQRTDKERLAVCSGCRKAWYCDEECQRHAWKRGLPLPHKSVCRLVAAQNMIGASTPQS